MMIAICRIPIIRRLLFPLLIVAMAAQGATARACSLDGIASISMNGTLASLTAGAPSSGDVAHWAPFTLLAAAPGAPLRLSEDLSKVRTSLTASMLKTPFRWVFDDSARAQGWSVTHRFSQLGWHTITVDYFWPARQRWITFDSARLQIVPASQLWRANLSYYLDKAVVLLLRVLVWGAALALVAFAIWRWCGMSALRRWPR